MCECVEREEERERREEGERAEERERKGREWEVERKGKQDNEGNSFGFHGLVISSISFWSVLALNEMLIWSVTVG